MTAAKNQKRHPLPRLGVFGQPELPTTQAAPGRVRWAALAALLAVCLELHRPAPDRAPQH